MKEAAFWMLRRIPPRLRGGPGLRGMRRAGAAGPMHDQPRSPHPPAGAAAPGEAQKPRFRGVLHQVAAVVAAGAGLALVSGAPTGRAAAAAAVFAASLVVLFAVSATYHRITWSAGARAWMRRADHAAIFVLIAGTFTPVALLGLPAETS